MTIEQLKKLRDQAVLMQPFPDPEWPPSIYYRFLGLVAKETNTEVFVECGTCGGGASYNVAKLSPNTKVISIDVNKYPQVSEVERRCPNFQFVLGDSVKSALTIGEEHKGKIGLLFIDTDHTYEHTWAEFNAWSPYLKPGAIVCCDDLNREGMDRFWAELKYVKTGFNELSILHISGAPTDGGFGAFIC